MILKKILSTFGALKDKLHQAQQSLIIHDYISYKVSIKPFNRLIIKKIYLIYIARC